MIFGIPAGAVPLAPTIELNGGTGSVEVTAPPGLGMRIEIIGSDNGTGGFEPGLEGAFDTLVTFFYGGLEPFMLTGNWSYYTDDGPAWDPFGYVVADTREKLTTDAFSDWMQNGTFGFLVEPNTTFGFYIYSFDNANGLTTATVEIAAGVIPGPAVIPLPATAMLLLPALGSICLMRRRGLGARA